MNRIEAARPSDCSARLASIAHTATLLLAAAVLRPVALSAAPDLASADLAAAGFVSDSATTVIDRGPDFAVYRSVGFYTDDTGRLAQRTNQFTLLENALHYVDSGQ